MIANLETGPKELIRSMIYNNEFHLSGGVIIPTLGTYDRYFGRYGTFELASGNQTCINDSGNPKLMWSEDLLVYDPEETRLQLSGGGKVAVLDREGETIHSISADRVRLVNRFLTRMVRVRASGFLMDQDERYFLERRYRDAEYAEETLANRPDRFMDQYERTTFLSVDPALAGDLVMRVVFYVPIDFFRQGFDGVAISRDRTLLPRSLQFDSPLTALEMSLK